MKKSVAALALLATLCYSLDVAAQNPQAATPERSQVIQSAKEVMQKVRYCAFMTIGNDGHPQARVVDPFPPEEDMTIWIATNPVTRKVSEIRKDPHVTLFYFDPENPGYVTLHGTAKLVNDPVEKAKHWKDDWASFYKDEFRGDDFVLIRVKASRLEIVSFSHGLMNDPKTWRPVLLDLR